MDKLNKITFAGLTIFILMGLSTVIFSKYIPYPLDRVIIGLIGCFMFFWVFFIMLKQNEANCDKTEWSE